jgi:hypothetical protein
MLKVLSIEELTIEQTQKARSFLSESARKGPIEDIFWLEMPKEKLAQTQIDLLSAYGPYKVAIELTKNMVRFELLIRSESLYNIGGGNITQEQLNFLLEFYKNIYQYLDAYQAKAE